MVFQNCGYLAKLLRFDSTSLPRGLWKSRLRQSAWLSINKWITVAGQHRTYTGFDFKPSHPGKRHLNRQSL